MRILELGVLLMVGTTVTLGAGLAIFSFGMNDPKAPPPKISITIANNPETPEADFKIQHKYGDTLKGGDWKLSIVEAGNPPVFAVANQSSDFSVGFQIHARYLTEAGGWVSNSVLSSDGAALISNHKYNVKLVHISSNAILIDTDVEVR